MSEVGFLLQGVANTDSEIIDIEVLGDRISRIGKNLESSLPVIAGEGSLVLPGLVDLHTHLREPGKESSETVLSGSQAAIRGAYSFQSHHHFRT